MPSPTPHDFDNGSHSELCDGIWVNTTEAEPVLTLIKCLEPQSGGHITARISRETYPGTLLPVADIGVCVHSSSEYFFQASLETALPDGPITEEKLKSLSRNLAMRGFTVSDGVITGDGFGLFVQENDSTLHICANTPSPGAVGEPEGLSITMAARKKADGSLGFELRDKETVDSLAMKMDAFARVIGAVANGLYEISGEALPQVNIPLASDRYISRAISGILSGEGASKQGKEMPGVSMIPPEEIATYPRLEHVAGQDRAMQELQLLAEQVRIWRKIREFGGSVTNGAILYGAPGNGKTMSMKALCRDLLEEGTPTAAMMLTQAARRKYVGESESYIRDHFSRARELLKSGRVELVVIYVDEIDAVFSNRNEQGSGSTEVNSQMVSQLLTEMGGMKSSDGILLIGSTNRPEILDGALVRAGRFDTWIGFGSPKTPEDQVAVFKSQMTQSTETVRENGHPDFRHFTADIDLLELAGLCEGLCCAAHTEIIKHAITDKILENSGDSPPEPITQEFLMASAKATIARSRRRTGIDP